MVITQEFILNGRAERVNFMLGFIFSDKKSFFAGGVN